MTVTEVPPHSFDKYLAILEETLKRSLDNEAKIRNSMLEDAAVYIEIKNEYEILERIGDSLRNGKVIPPSEFRGLLQSIMGSNANEGLDKPYEQVYLHGLSGFARSAMVAVGSAVAENLSIVIPVQLKFVLSWASLSYLNRNPDSKEYVITKLRELESSDGQYGFTKAMRGLGVPEHIASLLSKAIWKIATCTIVKDTRLDSYINSITYAINEAKNITRTRNA